MQSNHETSWPARGMGEFSRERLRAPGCRLAAGEGNPAQETGQGDTPVFVATAEPGYLQDSVLGSGSCVGDGAQNSTPGCRPGMSQGRVEGPWPACRKAECWLLKCRSRCHRHDWPAAVPSLPVVPNPPGATGPGTADGHGPGLCRAGQDTGRLLLSLVAPRGPLAGFPWTVK